MIEALKSAGVTADEVDHVVVTGTPARAVKVATKAIGARPDAVADDLTSEVGNTGAAHWALVLDDTLDRPPAPGPRRLRQLRQRRR